MKLAKLGGFSLGRQEVPHTEMVAQRNVAHLWVYDRSGSMYNLIQTVVDDMKDFAGDLHEGDLLSIGWFSGEGDFRFVLTGHRVGKDSIEAVKRILDANSTVRNTTCFSEIMRDAEKVIHDLNPFGLPYSLVFFTDGYPVVSDYRQEIDELFRTIARLEGEIAESLVVGYGDWYNRELLAKVAAGLGGTLVHCSRLEQWREYMGSYITDLNPARKVEVQLDWDGEPEAVFAVSDSRIIEFKPNGSTVMVPQGTEAIFYFTKEHIPGPTAVLFPEEAWYAAAAILANRGRVDEAIDILSDIGDKHFVDELAASWTNDEVGKVAAFMNAAVYDERQRFKTGRKVGCKPDMNRFCLLDALSLLMQDDAARFCPARGFEYKRIGAPRVVRTGYPHFWEVVDPQVKIDGLVWNDNRLNLSMRVFIPGEVRFEDDEYHAVHLPPVYRCGRYRTFTLVRDGVLNATRLPLKLGIFTHGVLKEEGMILGVVDGDGNVTDAPYAYDPDAVYLVDLTAVPLINKGIADGNTLTAEDVCRMTWRILELEALQKVINDARKTVEAQLGVKVQEEGLTMDQQLYLEERGIKKGVFNPPYDKGEVTDFYEARTFAIKVRGYSSLPKVADVRARLKDGKPLTGPQKLVAKALDVFEQECAAEGQHTEDPQWFLEWLDEFARDVRKQLVRERAPIQRAKFSVILAHRWFDGLPRNGEASLVVDDITYNFVLGTERIEI